MKRLLETTKVRTMVGLWALCALVVLTLGADAYAFDPCDVPVLMYHKVDDVTPTIYWVSTDDFRDQMFLLDDLGYETVDLDDLYNHIQDVTELPAKPIILTFDDSYENAYTHAMPLTGELGFIGVANTGPTDYISYTDPNRQENLWDQPPEPTAWHLIWPEVTALYNAGWAVAAHSKTHGQLVDMIIAEEVDSRNIIASEASVPTPNFYSYPFGESSAALIQALQNEGYLGAMDASGGIENTGSTDIWHIKRIGIMRDDTLAQFASKIGESAPTIYRLTVNTVGNGSVDINPDRPFYYNGNVVTLTAIADPCYTFIGWSDDLTGSTTPDTITMDSDKTVTATFVFNDTAPPEPNVMTWASEPNATGTTSISMTATTATDDSTPVEYYFECTTDGDANSNWQTNETYEAAGLTPDTTYTFRVKARDSSPAQNETAWSTEESATTDAPDTDPPEPNIMTWNTLPYATGTTSISMTATTATDDSTPVEYYFECTTDGDANSNWQTSETYVAEGLNPSTQYTFRVKARDSATVPNETGWSTAESATTDALPPELPWSDDFESGNFTAGGWTTLGSATVSDKAEYSGVYGALLKGTAWIEKAVSTAGFTTIHVKYVRMTDKLAGTEYLYVEWYDGATWHELEATQDAVWVSKDMTCGAGADNNTDFKVRFRTNASNASEIAKVDDVEITGTAAPLQYTVTFIEGADGSITGTLTQEVDHGSDCTEVNAVADANYHFDGWTDDYVGMDNPLTIQNVTDDMTITANFAIDEMKIFGYITEPDANIPVEGVFIDANNGDDSDTTDANGYYQLTVDYGWSGTVEPNKTDYTFEPNSIEYFNVTTDQNDNYIAILDTFIISGYAYEMLTPLDDVLVSPDSNGGPFTNKYYGGGWDRTDANGYYEVLVDCNWSGKVVPSKYAYAFEPNSIEYFNVTSDQNELQDYIGTLLTYTITGCIKNSHEVPIAGVVVDANNGGVSDITDVNGYYEVWVDYNWLGTVTPSKAHYTFDPNDMGYIDVLYDIADQNYIAINIYDLDCDGSIGYGDVAIMCGNWLDGPDLPGDFYKDEDDIVNFLDFADFGNVYGD